jgi:RNA polymerase sigma factor (sigma-70 family)
MQDALLIRRYVREQSQAAFAEIVSHYRRLVYFTCLREAGDAQVAEDAAQSVFLILARRAPALSGKVSLAGWLFQTARLTAKDALRRERRRQKSEKEAALIAEQEARMPRETTLLGEVLNETLASLKEAEREAVLLRFFEDMSFREIGTVLNVSEDTAQKRVTRALGKMRAQLARHDLTLTITALAGLLEAEASHTQQIPHPGSDPSSFAASSVSANTLSQQIAQGVLQAMWITKAGLTAGIVCLGLGAVSVGVAALETSATPAGSTTAEREMTAADWSHSPTIQEIRITGNHTVRTADILSRIQAKPGDVLDLHKLQSGAITPIFNMGGFDLVGPFEISAIGSRPATVQSGADILLPATPASAATAGKVRVIVTIPVTEKLATIPNVRSPLYFEDIRITGNYQVPTADILKHVAIKPGDVADGQRRVKVAQAVAAIKAMNEFDTVGPPTVIQSYNRVIVTIPVVEKPD